MAKGESKAVTDFLFLDCKITVDGDCSHEIRRWLLLGRKAVSNLDSMLKKQRHHFANKGPHSQSYGLSNGHVWMWVLDHKGDWAPKNWCFWTVVLEKTPENPLDCREIKLVNLKGNQPWIHIGRTDAEAEALVFWSPAVKNWQIWEDPDAEKDWGQEKKRVSEDEMAGWHNQCNGLELGQTLGDGEGQGGLTCCSPWGLKESDRTGWLNNNMKLKYNLYCLVLLIPVSVILVRDHTFFSKYFGNCLLSFIVFLMFFLLFTKIGCKPKIMSYV